MKIAVYHNLPTGGALLHLSNVVDVMKKRGHEVHLFTPSTAEQDFANLPSLVDQHTIWPRESWEGQHGLLNPFFYQRHLKKAVALEKKAAEELARGGYDGIYLGQCRLMQEPPLLCFLPPELPSVLFCQEPKRSFYEERFLAARLSWPWYKKLWRLPTINWMMDWQKRSAHAATEVFCNSAFSKTNIQKAYALDATVNHLGVDTNLFSPTHEERENLLLSVGAMDPSKNHGMAIEIAGLRPGGKDYKVMLVTDRSHGDEASRLLTRAETLGVEVEVKIKVPNPELPALFRRAFAVIYCPLNEPMGLVSVEAQATGTPVLGRDEGGIKETLSNGVGGYRFFNDPKPYADQLEAWQKDPEGYQKICSSARESAVSYWEKEKLITATVERTEAIFSRTSSS